MPAGHGAVDLGLRERGADQLVAGDGQRDVEAGPVVAPAAIGVVGVVPGERAVGDGSVKLCYKVTGRESTNEVLFAKIVGTT